MLVLHRPLQNLGAVDRCAVTAQFDRQDDLTLFTQDHNSQPSGLLYCIAAAAHITVRPGGTSTRARQLRGIAWVDRAVKLSHFAITGLYRDEIQKYDIIRVLLCSNGAKKFFFSENVYECDRGLTFEKKIIAIDQLQYFILNLLTFYAC